VVTPCSWTASLVIPVKFRPCSWRVFSIFSSRRRQTRFKCDWSSDVCSSDLSAISGVATETRVIGSCVVIGNDRPRSEEHTSELQSHLNLVCRLLLEKKK